jgi:hypothetical protein
MIMKAELLETTSVTVDPEWLKIVMKAELLETIAEIQSQVERELEWKLTDYISTKEAHALLDPVTFSLVMLAKRIEEMAL